MQRLVSRIRPAPLIYLVVAALCLLTAILVLQPSGSDGLPGLFSGLIAATAVLYLLVRRRRLNRGASKPRERQQRDRTPRNDPSTLVAVWADRGARPVERIWTRPEPVDTPVLAPPVPAPLRVTPTAAPEPPMIISPLMGRRTQVGEMLQWAQNAARSGDRAAAHNLIVEVLRVQPNNVEAWLWRAATTDDPAETADCLKHVLELEPDNHFARQGLTSLQVRDGA